MGMTAEELNQIKNERDEMEKHMTDMFDLAFMINNHDDLVKSQEHHEKLSRMVTHYMGSIQQSYGYMSEKAIKALERESCTDAISREEALKEMQNYYDDCAKTSEYTRLGFETAMNVVRELPPVKPERTTITYKDCSEAMMKMWIDNVLTDGQYNKIMDKLNAKHIADMKGVSE